jgi:hypothetical protein
MAENQRPDFNVKLSRKLKSGKYTNLRVGAAWKQKDGAISIRLEPGVGVVATDGVFLTLFPNDERDDRRERDDRGSRRGRDGDRHNFDDGGDRR